MGYFRRKIDRARARQHARELHDGAIDRWPWESIPDAPPRESCYLRFSVSELDELTRKRVGIFTAAYGALRSPDLDTLTAERLNEELDWFALHLDGPSYLDERAIFFFKSTATECMRHMWSLLHALRDAGAWADVQAVASPGRVVFEDEHQVAVVPWADADLR